jgi:hypothetical protein
MQDRNSTKLAELDKAKDDLSQQTEPKKQIPKGVVLGPDGKPFVPLNPREAVFTNKKIDAVIVRLLHHGLQARRKLSPNLLPPEPRTLK